MARPAFPTIFPWRMRMPTRARSGSSTGRTRCISTSSAGSSLASTDDVVGAIRSLQRAYLIGVEGVTEIWLVRHADVYDQGELVSDPSLSPLGHRPAERLGLRLTSVEIRPVYAS